MDDVNKLNEIARYLAGEMSTVEQKALEQWIHATESNQKFYEDHIKLWELAEEYNKKMPFEINAKRSWDEFDAKLEKDTGIKKSDGGGKRISLIRQLLRVAAVFLVTLGTGYMVLQNQKDPVVPMLVNQSKVNEKKEITLPDGSKIWLNGQTTLRYTADFNPRMVSLEGEAFFEVVHQDGKPFEILSDSTKTIVLGTSFNVRAYPEESFVEVNVREGKVAFQENTNKDKALILTAGDAGTFNKKENVLSKSTPKISNATSWKTGELNFNNTLIAEVLPTLERYFGKTIKVNNPKILNCHITGKYQKPTLNQLLNVLAFSLDIEIKTEQNYFILSGTGCD